MKAYVKLAAMLLLFHSTAFALKIGVVFFDPPLVYNVNQGFNIEIINRLCRGINQTCDIQLMKLNEAFPSLDNKLIDAFVGVFITPQRQQKYIFTLPYLLSQGRFMALANTKLTSVEQLKGKKVGIVAEEAGGGVFHDYIAATYPNSFDLVNFTDVQDILTALINGSIDAAVIHNTAVDYWVQNSAGKFSTVGPLFSVGAGESIMALPANQALIDGFNVQIKQIEANGEYLNFYNTYFPNVSFSPET